MSKKTALTIASLVFGWASAACCMAQPGGLPAESRQFDFWVGTWDVNLRIRQPDSSWRDQIQAEARIYSVLDGKAVLELWESRPIRGFSLRYFDVAKDRWFLWLNWPRQNRSAGSSLEGSFRHGRGDFFSTGTNPQGQEVISRYTFADITPTSLRWNDGYSTDGGKTWREDWIMEFSRTAKAPLLPPEGGPAHTFQNGGLCPLESFRTFESLAGRHLGEASWPAENGAWQRVPAELIGYRINGGCAVLSFLRFEREGARREVLSLHTWNTHISQYEENLLDSEPSSPLAVYYGAEEDGTVGLVRSSVNGEEEGSERRLWSGFGETLRLESQNAAGETGEWIPSFRAEFPSPAPE